MENHEPPGFLLSRRDVILCLGTAGAAWLMAGNATPRQVNAGMIGPLCLARPEQTEGPYFIDERLNRSDIRSDPASGLVKQGTPLALTILVSRLDSGNCRPLAGAQVDLWHCDAQGLYSDVRDPGFSTISQKFLRGYQTTDAGGEVRFNTVYPGWYPGRTVHIHFKIRTAPLAQRTFEFTSQLYFDDELTDHVHKAPPYAAMGPGRARNRHDGFFWRGGHQLMLDPKARADGYAATFAIGLQIP